MKTGRFGELLLGALIATSLGCGSVSAQVLKGSTTQKMPCIVNSFRMRIATGGDDLRGGNDNLNVTIRYGEKGFQGEANVNHSANWGNNTVHVVDIKLRQPVPLNEIKSITLDHLANGGLTISPEMALSPVGVIAGLKTADNWDMQSLEVAADGEGTGTIILRYGPKRFTGSDAILNTRVSIPANSCGTGLSASGGAGSGSGAGKSGGKLTPQRVNELLAKVHRTAGKTSPVVTNPGARQGNMATLALLQQQKQIALTERNQTPTGTTTNTTPAPSRTPMITRAPAAIRGPIATTATPPPSSGTNRTVLMTQPNTNTALACTTFSTAMITAVSGQQGSAAVFTQDPQYNLFTIRGCNFGNGRGQAQLNSSDGRKLSDLTIDTWTDTLITAEVPPMLTGALDQNNVTLVLFPTNGAQAQKSGFRFYALRAELHVTSIPASQVSLASINDDGGSPVTAKLSSPYTANNQSVSGGVDRVTAVRFPGGTDVFDFSKLKPGFSVEKFQVTEVSMASCGELGPTTTTYYTDGTWSWQQTGNTINVTWQEAHCHDAYFGDNSDASYGLDVWLVGPVLGPGDSPWQNGVK